MSLETTIHYVEQLFGELDRQIAEVKQQTQLECITGCGHCCNNPNVEVTVLEFLPLAQFLSQRGESDTYLTTLAENPFSAVCTLYRSTSPDGDNGFCAQYAWRGLICRLFGFSARFNRHGQREFVTCRRIKQHFPDRVGAAQAIADAPDTPLPVIRQWYLRLTSIEPGFARERLPINQAITRAIERVEFHDGWHRSRSA